MNVRELTLSEIESTFEDKLLKDFNIDELKPIQQIKQLFLSGNYLCLGMFDDREQIIAYAYFCRSDKFLLLDYYAVDEHYRAQGYGSKFLEMIKSELESFDGIIGEVERAESAESETERIKRSRRIAFYLKNGMRTTGLVCKLFGFDYQIMYLPLKDDCTNHTVFDNLNQIYYIMFDKEQYAQNVFLKKTDY